MDMGPVAIGSDMLAFLQRVFHMDLMFRVIAA